jgi:hypothetical protein
MSAVLKTAQEWLDEMNAQNPNGRVTTIVDADGWRHDDGVWMDTPITLEDFQERLGQCTVMEMNA